MIPSVMINLSTMVAPQRASSRPWLHISEQEKKKKINLPKYPIQRRKRSLCRWLTLLSQNRNCHFFFH
ncbi:hypothetical protein NC651_033196 [Populus alba x Populus x berolinensis]|nr:hypothetical protein NC651_033196 [Populus alba x Populus x berolinensis]